MQMYIKHFGIYSLVWAFLFCITTGGMTIEAFKHNQYNLLLLTIMIVMWFMPGLMADVLRARCCWSDRRLRYLAVPVLGGAIALFLLGYSLLPQHTYEWADWIEKAQAICPVEHLDEFHHKVAELNLLENASRFVNDMPQIFATGAMTAMVVMYIFDAINERWLLRSFLIGFCLAAVPSLVGITSYATKSGRPDLLLSLLPIAIACMIPGVFCVLFACTVRAECWQPYFPWLS